MWLLVSMVMTAVSLCMAAWWLGTPFVRVGLTGGHARPILLIVLWPWVLAVTPLCNRCMSWHWRRRIQQLLEQADAGHYGTPQQFLAWQCVLFLISASGVALLLAGRGGPGMTALVCLAAGALAALWPVRLLRERIRRRRTDMLRAFPFLLDMVTLCVEAGLNLQGAMKQAAEKGPQGPLREEVRHLLADIRAGGPRQEALRRWAQRCDLAPIQQFVGAVAQAETSGMSLAPVLRAQADQWRTERFLHAEKQALEAPVKLMFPLIFCIFPCSFLIIAFPIATQLLALNR